MSTDTTNEYGMSKEELFEMAWLTLAERIVFSQRIVDLLLIDELPPEKY